MKKFISLLIMIVLIISTVQLALSEEQQEVIGLGFTEEQKAFYKQFGYDIEQDERELHEYGFRVFDGNIMIETMEQFDCRVTLQQEIFLANGVDFTNAQVGDLLFWFSAPFIAEDILVDLKSTKRVTGNLEYYDTKDNILNGILLRYLELANANSKSEFLTLVPLISGFKTRQCAASIEHIFQEVYIASESKNSIGDSLVGYIPEYSKIVKFLLGTKRLPYYISEIDSSGLITLRMYVYLIKRTDAKTGATSLSDLSNYYSNQKSADDALANVAQYIDIVNRGILSNNYD